MNLALLHLDDALLHQSDFLMQCAPYTPQVIEARDIGSQVRLWGKDKHLTKVRTLLQQSTANTNVVFYGSGDFHHISALLLERVAEREMYPFTVLHFDNHPDWVHFKGGMHCGSWVNRALDLQHVAKVITVGVCSEDLTNPERKGANLNLLKDARLELFPWHHAPSRVKKDYGESASYAQKDGALHWNTLASMEPDAFITLLLSRITTDAVYITLDKDVLSLEDAVTNWDQGQMGLSCLLEIITSVAEKKRLIGVDVNGDYSQPHYTGTLATRLLKRGEIFLDQPRAQPDMAAANSLNSYVNQCLLSVLDEVMA